MIANGFIFSFIYLSRLSVLKTDFPVSNSNAVNSLD